jgi:hypothetical protein
MDWTAVIKSIAPTVATALGGPLAGAAVTAIGAVLGVSEPTQEKIADMFSRGQLTPDHIAELKKLELQYQNDEKERGFKYAALAAQDRDSARRANVAGGTQKYLFWLSILLLTVSLGSEVAVLFVGYPTDVPEIVVGRVLGLLDSVALLVLGYWYGTTDQSRQKTELLSKR